MLREGVTLLTLMVLQGLGVQAQEMFITHPKIVLRGREFPVDLVLASPPESIDIFKVNFLDVEKDVVFQNGATIARTSFEVPLASLRSEATITVTKPGDERWILSSNVNSIVNVSSTTIVQTDKGKYKPGQSVLIRVLNIDSDLKPLGNEIQIIVKDSSPSNSIVYEKISNSTDQQRGIIEANFTLIQDAPLGEYKIIVYGLTKKEATFTVEKYALPRFETILTLHSSRVAKKPGMTSIPLKGEVRGVYTAGQFVEGKLTLRVVDVDDKETDTIIDAEEFTGFKNLDLTLTKSKYLNSAVNKELKIEAIVEERFTGNTANTSTTFTILPKPFAAQPVLPLPDFSDQDSTYTLSSHFLVAVDKELKIEAIVEEQFTGNTANTSTTFTILPKPFAAQPVQPLADFSDQDSTYTLSVKLVNSVADHLDLNEWTEGADDIANYRLHYEWKQNVKVPGNSWQYNTETRTDYKDMTANPQTITMNVNNNTQLSNRNLKVWIQYVPGDLNSTEVPVEVRKLTSYSKAYIMVVLADSDQDDQACFKIEHANDKTYYQVVGNSYQTPMMPYNMGLDKQCFTLTKDHVPLFEVIGYKVHSYESSKQDEVLVNRVVGEHTISMQRQVSMTINPQTVKPGSMVNIEISTTATGTSYIAMRGVDKSAFLLARGHDVSQDKIDSLSIKDRLFNNDEDRDKPDIPGPMPMVRSMVWWPGPYEPEISPGNIIRDAGLSLTTTPNLQFKTSGFICQFFVDNVVLLFGDEHYLTLESFSSEGHYVGTYMYY